MREWQEWEIRVKRMRISTEVPSREKWPLGKL